VSSCEIFLVCFLVRYFCTYDRERRERVVKYDALVLVGAGGKREKRAATRWEIVSRRCLFE
jgi:hypothetical protein